MIDIRTCYIPVPHFRIGIVCRAACSRAVVHQLQAVRGRPFDNRIIVPLVGWQKEMSAFFFNTKLCQLFIRIFKIGIKLYSRNEQTVSVSPVAIQQVFVGVRAQVMAVCGQLFYQFIECRFSVEITCKKEIRFYIFFLSSRAI